MQSPDNAKSDKLLDKALIGLVLSLIVFLFSRTVSEYDLWGHLKFGLDYLAAGKLLDIDPYSYISSGYKWIEHCWLFEIAIGTAYRIGAATGLCIIKLVFVWLILASLLGHLVKKGVPAVWTGILVIVAAITMAPALYPLRPHLCTYLFFMLTILALENADEKSERWLYVLPPVFAIWCNSHGGYLAGLGMVFVWIFVDLVSQCMASRTLSPLLAKKTLLRVAIFVACALATLLNPYGIELPAFLVNTLSGPRPEITEWRPLSILSITALFYLSCLSFFIASFSFSKHKRSPALMAVFACAAVQPLAAERHVPLFVIAGLIVAAPHIASSLREKIPVDLLRILPNARDGFRRSFAMMMIIAAIVFFVLSFEHVKNIKIGSDMPIAAVNILEKSGAEGNLATFFDWGEYCIWHLYPKVKVSTDGRREAAYSTKAQALNLQLTYGLNDWDELLKSYPTPMVLANKTTATFDLMKMKSDYELVFEDQVCGLFVQKGSLCASKLNAAAKESAGLSSNSHECLFP